MNQPVKMEQLLVERAFARRMPITGVLELLPLCNMNCEMCYVRLSRAEMEAQGRLRTAQEWIGLAREMAQAGTLFLLLTGGEPLLLPDFRTLYLELRRMGFILTLNTNGTLIDEDWAAFFGAHKPRRINVTLYGADGAAYETLCHYPGGYDRALRGIRLLREAGVDVRIGTSVTRRNRQDMEKIFALREVLDAPVLMDTYMVSEVRERSLPFNTQSRLSPQEAARAGMQALRAESAPEDFERYVRDSLRAVREGRTDHPVQVSCQAGGSSFAVTWQGELRPCLNLTSPSAAVFDMGFDAAWKRIVEQTQAIRMNPRCGACRLRPVCKTCAANAYWETGACDGVPEYLCRMAEETLRLLEAEEAALSGNERT